MEMLAGLWLPILLSAAAVWVASAVVWMALPHHQDDWKGLPDEAGFVAAIRSLNIPPGVYGFPHFGTRKEACTPEAQEKWKEGPSGQLNVWKPMGGMGKNMVLSFLVYLVVSVLVGYIGAAALPPGAGFAKVMQVLGTASVLAYTIAILPGGIWFQANPRALAMCVIDGIAYGLITGAVFGALWPEV